MCRLDSLVAFNEGERHETNLISGVVRNGGRGGRMQSGKRSRRPGSFDTIENHNVEFDVACRLGNVVHDNHGAEARGDG